MRAFALFHHVPSSETDDLLAQQSTEAVSLFA
jgi:hypothetical protein